MTTQVINLKRLGFFFFLLPPSSFIVAGNELIQWGVHATWESG